MKASNPICGPWAPAGRSAVVLHPCTGESGLYHNSPVCSMADLRGALISWRWQDPPDMVTAWVIRVTEEIFFFFFGNIRQMTGSVEGLAQVRPS